MDERDIDMVAAAFDRLLTLAAKNTDGQTCWTIAAVKEDVIDILAGTWHADEAEEAPAALQLDDVFAFWGQP